MNLDIFSFLLAFEKVEKELEQMDLGINFSNFSYEKPLLEEVEIDHLKEMPSHCKKALEETVEEFFKNHDKKDEIVEFFEGKAIAHLLSKRFGKCFDNEKWLKAYCPLCGQKPGLGYIDSEGRRFLQCSFCAMKWRFRRVVCPFCDEESGYYSMFEINNRNVRIEYCMNCKGYLKTFVLEPDNSSPYRLDMETLSIDEWAHKEGFKKNTVSMIGINFTS
jgi:formate dehydrogenase maturation protein FdhE